MAEDDDDYPRYSEPAVSPADDYSSAPQAAQYVQPQPRRMSAAEFEQAGGRYEEQQQQQPQATRRMSAAEFEQAGGKYEKEEEAPSGIGSAVRGFLHGVGPMGAAVATGAITGTAIGGLPGTVIGGLAGLVTGAGTSYLQEKAIEAVAPAEAEAYRKAREEHPYLTGAGEVAAAGPYFGVRAAGTVAQKLLTRGIAGGAGAGIDAAQQLAIEHKFDPLRTLEAGAGSALLAGRPTRLGRALGVPGEHPAVAPAAEPPAVRSAEAPPAEPPLRTYPPATATEPHTAVTEIPDAFTQVKPEPHGTPGPEAAAGVAQEAKPTADPAATEFAATRAAKPGPEDYGKQATPSEGGGGVNVGDVDPTLAHVINLGSTPQRERPVDVQMREQGVEPRRPDEPLQTAAPEDIDARMRAAGVPEPRAPYEAPPLGAERAFEAPPALPPAAVAAERPPEVLRGPEPEALALAGMSEKDLRWTMVNGKVSPATRAAAKAELQSRQEAPDKLPTRSVGDLHIEPNPAGGHVLMRGDEAISQHPNVGQAMIAMNKMVREAGIPTRQAMARTPLEFPRERMRPLAGAPTPEQFNARVTQRLYEDMKARYGQERADAWLAKQAPAELPAGVTRLRGEPDMVRRDVTGRDRSGRPIQTEPLPIGTEQAILEKGMEKATGSRLPPEQAPPELQPARRQPAVVPEKAPPLVEATESDKSQGLLASLRRNLFSTVMGPSTSAEAGQAAVRAAAGPLAQVKEKALTRFTNELHQVANEMQKSPELFNKFTDAYETGQIGSLPDKQKPLAKALQRGYSDFWAEIKKLPKADQMEETKNYLTHMYDNNNGAVDKFVGEWFSPGAGSLQKRKYPTFADAREAGLTPLSNNPIEHFSRYADGISRYLTKQRIIEDLKGQGRFAYFKPETVGASGSPSPQVKGRPPDGWAEMPWAAQQFGRQAFAPRDVAETLNQFYSRGLSGGAFKDVYEAARHIKNTWTAAELGLSAYHATTMSVEAANAGNARALQMASTGDVIGAAKQLAKSLTVLPETLGSYSYGRELRKSYREQDVGARGGWSGLLDRVGQQLYGERVQSPEVQKIMGALAKANVQPGNLAVTREYDMSKLGNLWDAGKRGSLMHELSSSFSPQAIKDSYGLSLPKGGLDLVRRSMQTISKPLFQHFIPELKLGSMMKDMEVWTRANPNATDSQLVRAARKIADSTDNRMGEMNYNNMFINKAAKEIGILGLRSFGFTVGGPIREIGGGLASGISGAAQRQNRLDPRSEHWDPRTAYALAFLPTIAAISGAYQYLRTGKGPEDWRDLVTPQTGGMVKSAGQKVPERILVPGYHKDFLGYFVNPKGALGELEAKLAAPWTTLLEQLTGKDWRDKPYVPPRASTSEWLQAHGKAALSHMVPIGPKQLAEGTKEGSALTVPEQLLGVRTPGAYMLNPKGSEAYMTKQRQQDWKAQEKREKLPPRPLPPSPYR